MLTAVNARIGTTLPKIIALARDGDAAVGVNGIALPLSSPPEPWLAHILPLTSGARRDAGIAHSAVAAVFVHKASIETPSAMETMSKLYRLTPGELRVLAALSEVGGIACRSRRYLGSDRQDASSASVREDRHQPADRARQTRCGTRKPPATCPPENSKPPENSMSVAVVHRSRPSASPGRKSAPAHPAG